MSQKSSLFEQIYRDSAEDLTFDELLIHHNEVFGDNLTDLDINTKIRAIFRNDDSIDYDYLQNKAFKFLLRSKSLIHMADLNDNIEKFQAEDQMQSAKYIKSLSMLLAKYQVEVGGKLQESTFGNSNGLADEELDEIICDWIDLVLNENYANRNAIKKISKGWAVSESEVRDIINNAKEQIQTGILH